MARAERVLGTHEALRSTPSATIKKKKNRVLRKPSPQLPMRVGLSAGSAPLAGALGGGRLDLGIVHGNCVAVSMFVSFLFPIFPF